MVAIFCGHLIEGTAPTVFGDGRQTRDWVEVGDVVRANLRAAESDCDRPGEHRMGPGDVRAGAAFGIGRCRAMSLDRCREPEFAPERPGEVRRSCLDVSRARRELGWEARVQLRDGLRTMLAGL